MLRLRPSLPRIGSPLLRCSIPILAVALATGVKLLLDPLGEQTTTPFLLFFGAIMISAFYGGLLGGIGATLLSAVSSRFLFLTLADCSVPTPTGRMVTLTLFVLEGTLVSKAVSTLINTEKQLQASQGELEYRIQERTQQLSQANQVLQAQIEERQQMERALRERDRRFRAIFNQTFQFIGLMQPDGLLLEANQTALDFGGLQRDEVVNRPFWDAHWWSLSTATQEQLREAIAQAAQGQFVRYEVEVLGRGNTLATIDFSIQPVRDESGQVILLIPEGRDITEQKQAQETLQRFFDSASMMMGIVELVDAEDIRHVTDNPAAAHFFGYPPGTTQNRLASQLGASPEHIRTWMQHYREAERTQAPIRFEYQHSDPEGDRWLSATVFAIPSQSHAAARFAYIVEDRTDQHRAAAQIRQLNADLERRVDERTAQLQQEIQQRQASEQQFRLVAESMPQIVWTALPDGTVDYYNQRWQQFSGIPTEAGQGWGWQPILHPEDEQPTLNAWVQAIQTGQLYECEHRIRRVDGEFRWHLSRGIPLRDEQNQILKWFGTATDIHDQKQTQAELQESQSRFRQLAETVDDVFWLRDIHTQQILYVNPAYEAIWGRSRARLYENPQDWLEAIQGDDRQRIEQLCQGQNHEGYDVTYQIRRPDQSIRYIRDRRFPVQDESGQVYRLAGLAEDITERQRTAAELLTRAQQQAAIARLGQRALSGIDLETLMEEAVRLTAHVLNVDYCKILELLPDKTRLRLRAGVGWQPGLVGDATVEADMSSQAGYTLSVQEPVIVSNLNQETRFSGPALLHQHQVVSGMSITISGLNAPFGVFGVHTTDHRSFTQDDVHCLQAIANILAEAIQRQRANETLQRQSEELATANRLKDEFLATISHELRTPLNSMLGWAKLLPTRQFPPTTTAKAIEIISRNTQSLAQLVEDVLDMSDIIRGQLDLQVAPVDVALVIEQAISAIQLAAQAKNIQVQSHLAFSTGVVMGDAPRLQQVVWNLLSNAVKFTPNGGQVQVYLTATDHQAQIRVVDSGQGISPNFLPFVFDRFRQEDSSITRTQGGLGLGLAIARYLVELHGGKIDATSPGIGQGATFTVTLPIAFEATALVSE